MNRYPDFASVRVLSDEQLQELLHRGDGPERVWAAWALGLRSGEGALPVLRRAADDSPDAGVRAQLAVMLAGFGQRDALAVLAAEDPDGDVRAAACRHLAGTSLPELVWVRTLLERLVKDDPATPVQVVLVELATAGAIAIDEPTLTRALGSTDRRLHERAADHLLEAWLDGDATPFGIAGLLDDPEPDLRHRAATTALDRLGAERFVELLSSLALGRDVLAEHLRAVERSGSRLPWPALATLAERDDGVDAELFAILTEPGPDSRPWLLSIVADEIWPASDVVIPLLPDLLAMDPPLSARESASARAIRERFVEWLEAPNEDAVWWDEGDREIAAAWAARTRASVDVIDRALARAEAST